jgi:hypothetical protein
MQNTHNTYQQSNIESEKISRNLFAIADDIALSRKNYLDYQSSAAAREKNKFISALSRFLFDRKWEPRYLTEKSLKHRESEIGASLFGGSTPRKQVLFFNDDRQNWYFYQGILDPKNPHLTAESLTLHYEVRAKDILRIDNRNSKINYMILEGEELHNFVNATHMYHQLVMQQLYGRNSNKSKK